MTARLRVTVHKFEVPLQGTPELHYVDRGRPAALIPDRLEVRVYPSGGVGASVSGRPVRRDGLVGTSRRTASFGAGWQCAPLADAPKWVLDAVREVTGR